jgi:hypothetical protein
VKAGGNVLVSFFTEVGQTYRIEGKEALESGPWTTVADNVAGTGARVQVMDPDGAGRPARFYRGRTLP